MSYQLNIILTVWKLGQKDSSSFDPTGLIAQSQLGNGEGIVYVALNYRLGLFGWLNGMGDHKLFPNVGLQDQRLGLQWYASVNGLAICRPIRYLPRQPDANYQCQG